MKKKIAIISLTSYDLFFENENVTHGGAELQMYFLAQFLAKSQLYEVKFLVGDYGQAQSIKRTNIEFIKTINLSYSEPFIYKFLKGIKLFIILIKINPEAVFATSANTMIGLLSLYKRIFRKKQIHRTASFMDVDKNRIKKSGISGKIYAFGLKSTDLLFTQTTEHQEILWQEFKLKSFLLYNAFDFKAKPNQIKNYALWVGRYDSIKKPELFLKMAENLPNLTFVMICPVSSYGYDKWLEIKHKSSILQNFTFIEQVPFAQIQEYFEKAKILVNTSDFEGFPNTFLQAAAACTPIASLRVNPDQFITQNNCGIYGNGDFTQFCQLINEIYFDEEKLRMTGLNNYEFLSKKHKMEAVETQFLQTLATQL